MRTRKSQTISHNLLRRFQGQEKLISKWAVLKSIYPNSRIYDYSPLKVYRDGRTGLSRNTIDSLIKSLIKARLAQIDYNGHLVLLSKKKAAQIAPEYSPMELKRNGITKAPGKSSQRPIFIKLDSDTATEMTDELRAVAICNKYRQFVYARRKEREEKERVLKRPKFKADFRFYGADFLPAPISIDFLAETWGVSRGNACGIIKRINHKFIVKFGYAAELIAVNVTTYDFQDHFLGKVPGTFHYRGKVYQKKQSEFLPMAQFKELNHQYNKSQ